MSSLDPDDCLDRGHWTAASKLSAGRYWATEVYWGSLGRSWGCPAVDPGLPDGLIDTVSDGALIWAYYPDSGFLEGSPWLAGYAR